MLKQKSPEVSPQDMSADPKKAGLFAGLISKLTNHDAKPTTPLAAPTVEINSTPPFDTPSETPAAFATETDSAPTVATENIPDMPSDNTDNTDEITSETTAADTLPETEPYTPETDLLQSDSLVMPVPEVPAAPDSQVEETETVPKADEVAVEAALEELGKTVPAPAPTSGFTPESRGFLGTPAAVSAPEPTEIDISVKPKTDAPDETPAVDTPAITQPSTVPERPTVDAPVTTEPRGEVVVPRRD